MIVVLTQRSGWGGASRWQDHFLKYERGRTRLSYESRRAIPPRPPTNVNVPNPPRLSLPDVKFFASARNWPNPVNANTRIIIEELWLRTCGRSKGYPTNKLLGPSIPPEDTGEEETWDRERA